MTMGRVIRLHTPPQCTGACSTLMTGCDCHHTDRERRGYPPLAAPDQPLMIQPGDMSERFEPPEGRCWACAAVCMVAAGVAAGMLWFAVRMILGAAE